MKILLLGKDGQVGRALQGTLPASCDVVAMGRAEADFQAPGELAKHVEAHRPDIIVNAAAYTAVDKAESEPDRAFRVNAGAVAELAKAAASAGAWLVHYSTDYVFDGSKSARYVETDATAPLNVYGRSKRDGELAIAASGAKHLIFRTSWVHARGGNNFIRKIISLAQTRDSLSVIDDQRGAPTGAGLIAGVTVAAIERIRSGEPIPEGIYHLAAAGETTWNGYARFVVAEGLAGGLPLACTPDTVAPVPSSAFPVAAQRPLNSRLSTEKLRTALGVTLPDWRDEVRETLSELLI